MKKLLALLLAFALVFSTVTVAFADEAIGTDADVCVQLNILTGSGNGVTAEYLATTPSRLQAAIMYLRLKGLEEDALAWTENTENFADADLVAWDGGKNILAYLKAHPELGWIGDNGNFKANDPIMTKAYYKVLLEALGYKQNTAEVIGDFTWGGVLEFAAEKGLVAVADVENFTVNDLAIATVEVLTVPMKGEETTLINTLIANGVVDEAVAVATGVYTDPADLALANAIAAAEEAIAALPAVEDLTLEDTEAVEAALALVEAVAALDEEAVLENGDVLLAVAEKLAELSETEMPLEVVSVDLVTMTEVLVTFNKTVDEDSAETAANYGIVDHEILTASLQEDGMSVLLTLDVDGAPATAVKLAQQEEFTVTVDNVKSADLVAELDDYESDAVTAFDATIPVAQGIELIGPNKFVITFSEPMDSTVVGTVEINDGIYGVTSAPADDTNEVTVTLSASSLTEGTYTVDVSDYKDFAGYAVLAKEFTLDYVTETTAPVAAVKSADQTEVVIEFNRAVTDEDGTDLDEDYFYHTFTSYNPDSVTVSTDKTEFTLDFTTTPLPEGSVKLVVDYDANDKDIEDEWGNKMVGNADFAVSITADKTKPEVAEVEVDAQDSIKIYFTEGLDQATAEDKDNFIVKDSDGDEVTINTLAYTNADDEYVVTMGFSSDLAGTYTVEIKDITDDALEVNTLVAVTESFLVEDSKGIDLSGVTAVTVEGTGSTADYIIVTFQESMATSGQYSVLDKDNYLLSADAGTTFAKLDSADTVALFGTGSKKVKITLKDNADFAVDDVNFRVAVARVADVVGNTSTMLSYTVDPAADTAPTALAANYIAIDTKTLEITFEGVLTTVVADGFSITKGAAGTAAAVSYKVEDVDSDDLDETVVTVTLKSAQQLDNSDATGVLTVNLVGSKLKSDTGKYVLAAGPVAVIDGIAPSLDTVEQTAADTIELTFDENVSVTNLNLAATDLVLTDADGDVLVAGLDYDLVEGAGAADDDTLYIDLINDYVGYEGDLEIDTKASVTYIFDQDGENTKLTAIEDEEIAVDATAPTFATINSVAVVSNDGDANAYGATDVITIKFSEKVGAAAVIANIAATGVGDLDSSVVVATDVDADGFATTFTVTLATTGSLAIAADGSMDLTVPAVNVVDTVGIPATGAVVFDLPDIQ